MKQIKGTVNAVELLGWLGADPELRYTPAGTAVCRFNVATKYLAGRDEYGQRSYETTWTQVETWERLAESCNSYLHKGSRVRIIGSLRTDTWVDRDTGQPRYKTYVRADDVLFLDARPEQREAIEAAEEAEEVMADIPF